MYVILIRTFFILIADETDLDEVLEVLAAQSKGDIAKKQKLDNAVSKMFKDCAKQILFVIILLLVMYSNQDSQLYHQNKALRDQFMSHKVRFIIFDQIYYVFI